MENKKPNKGILKSSSSFDKQEKEQKRKATKWDEMNIIATFHPPDKDYGHMKVEEPKTPFNFDYDVSDGAGTSGQIDLDELRHKLAGASCSSRRRSTPSASEDDDDEEEMDLSDAERAKRREFKNRRKHHYNEFKAVQLARKLIEEENDDDEASDNDIPCSSPTPDEV